MDKLKMLLFYAGGRLRRRFFMSVPEDEKDYAASRNNYLVAESSSMMTNELAGGTFLVAVLNYVQISDGLSGIIRSLGYVATLFQLLLMNRISKMSKHKPLIFFCKWQRIWLGFLFFIPGMNLSRITKCILIVLIYFYAQIAINLANPASVNLSASLVPEQIRGTYFSKKEAVAVFLTFISLFVAGLLFDTTKNTAPILGFRILGTVIIILALIDAVSLARVNEPKLFHADSEGIEPHGRLLKRRIREDNPEPDISLLKELKETYRHKGYQKALTISAVWTIAYCMTAPFNVSYQVKELGLAYTFITVIGLCTMLIRVFLMPRMGKLADRIGSEPIFAVMLGIMSLYHLIMVFTIPENGKLFFIIASIISAVGWSYINPAMLVIQIGELDTEKRTIQYTILSASAGIMGFLASVVGGRILEFLQSKEMMIGMQKIYAQQVMNLLAIGMLGGLILYLIVNMRKKECKSEV